MKKNAGFTLIELLVVVLIIGILSAVALPQYQKAVMKSKLASDLPLFVSVLQAQERYYLANGEFSSSFSNLDISVNCTTMSILPGEEYCAFDGGIVKIFNKAGFYLLRDQNYKLEYAFVRPEEGVVCWSWAGNKNSEDVCRSYGGEELPGGNLGQETFGKRFTIWKR